VTQESKTPLTLDPSVQEPASQSISSSHGGDRPVPPASAAVPNTPATSRPKTS